MSDNYAIITKNNLLTYSLDADSGIGIIIIDQKEQPTNLLSLDFITAFVQTAQRAIADPTVRGVIVTSGQKVFMAGGDLRTLAQPIHSAEDFFKGVMLLHAGMRSIETGGKPFVAAINGSALGGGLELCLCCHYRIALRDPALRLGFPEIKLGLLPGGGGTIKAPYLMGIQTAFMYLLQGQEVGPEKALQDGLINAIAETRSELIAAASKWIAGNPNPFQPWDAKLPKIPGGGLSTPTGAQVMMASIGNVRKITHGHYPAAQYILSIIHDGLSLPIDRALEIEARYFTKACQSSEAKNMIRTGFIGIQYAKKGRARPQSEPLYKVEKLGILGAGMMGAGIAYVSAKAGMSVVLKDVSIEAAEKGKDYSRQLVEKSVAKGYVSREAGTALLNNILTSEKPDDMAGCDLVIEAVFENPTLKAKVTQETEVVLSKNKVFASNTSTIPITQLAEASERPENFIGIHFFSPVDKMPLVEIIIGQKTSAHAIAAAVDFAVAIGKIPITVNDNRGFFTSRCFGTFTSEALFLLEEGVPAAMIENIAKQQGMPVGPLAVSDEVTITLGMHVFESDPTPNKEEYRIRYYNLQKMLVEKHNRTGKKDGRGFYDYPKNDKKHLWQGLNDLFNSRIDALDTSIIAKRIMHRQALESFKCLDEGILHSSTDGDIGSVLGWGFPIYTGGAISYIDYVGIDNFITDCDNFCQRFGQRWKVPDSLRLLAANNMSVHDFVRS